MNIPPILEGHRRELAQRIEGLGSTTRMRELSPLLAAKRS